MSTKSRCCPQLPDYEIVRLQHLRRRVNILWREWSPLLNSKAGGFVPSGYATPEDHLFELGRLLHVNGRLAESMAALHVLVRTLIGQLHQDTTRHCAAVKAGKSRTANKRRKARQS